MQFYGFICLLVVFLHSCVSLQKNKEKLEDSRETAVAVESDTLSEMTLCRNHFFQSHWGNEKVPLCPSAEGLVLLPPTYPPAQVFLGYTPQPVHIQFLRDLIEKLAEDPQRPQLVITISRHENDEAYRLFAKYLEPPFSHFVRFLSMPSDDALWTQDYFEVGISMVSGRGTLIDLPSHGWESESIPAALALSCQMGLVKQVSGPEKKKKGGQSDFGGNIEAFPGNFLVVGDHMSSMAQEILELNLSQDILKVNTSWGEPGHIDEIFSILPDRSPKDKTKEKEKEKDKEGECNFAILYSSPELALKILRDKGLLSKRDQLHPAIPEGEESIPVMERVDFSTCISLIPKDNYQTASPKLRKTCEALLKANETYAKLINQDLQHIKEAMEKRLNCNGFKTIPIPLLYAPEKIKSQYGGKEDFAMNINPNPINSISLGKTVVVAKQAYIPFEEDILSKIKSLGLEPHSIDGSYVHYLRGGIHSASNVVRMCRPSENNSRSLKE